MSVKPKVPETRESLETHELTEWVVSSSYRKSGEHSLSPLLHTISRAEAEIIATHLKYFHPRTPPHDVPNGKDLATVSQSVDKLSFAEFLTLIRSADPLICTLPVIAIETYQTKTLHQYSIVTIQLSDSKRTYVKLELQVDATSGATIITDGGVTILTALLTDDPSNLILLLDRPIAVLELTCNATQGPLLNALAELLDIIYKRVGKYDLYGRNCLWLTDLIFYGTAMKFKEACLAGRLVPDEGIRNYLHGGKSMFTASTQWIQRAPGLMETFKSFVAVGRMVTFNMDSEVEDVVEKWQHYMDAAPIV
ncbi:hypothetical protein V8D89_007123 [Ganoderma adspersum]